MGVRSGAQEGLDWIGRAPDGRPRRRLARARARRGGRQRRIGGRRQGGRGERERDRRGGGRSGPPISREQRDGFAFRFVRCLPLSVSIGRVVAVESVESVLLAATEAASFSRRVCPSGRWGRCCFCLSVIGAIWLWCGAHRLITPDTNRFWLSFFYYHLVLKNNCEAS